MDSSGQMHNRQYRDYTRYLRPVRPTQFTDLEMIQSIIQYLDPEEISSVSQLLGTRKGVIRITCKTLTSVNKVEDLVHCRRLAIGSVPLGLVEETGQFILVILENVPQFITDEQVDEEMSKYGVVVNSSKDYVEFHGCRIENERRNVLFTAIFNRSALIGGELRLFDTTVFAKAPYLDQEIAFSGEHATGSTLEASVSAGGSTNSAESSGAVVHEESGGGGGVGFDSSTIRSAAQAFQRKLHTSQQRQKERHVGAREKTNAHHRMSYQPQPVSCMSTISDHHEQPPPTTSHKISPPHHTAILQPIHQLLTEGEHSSKIGKSSTGGGGGGGASDARQMQKRSEAFEQLSQFLQ